MYSHVLCSIICSSISAQIFAVHVYIFIELTTYKEHVNLAGMGISGIETQQRFLKKKYKIATLMYWHVFKYVAKIKNAT